MVLHPNIGSNILQHTVLLTFPKILMKENLFNNQELLSDHFLYPHDLDI